MRRFVSWLFAFAILLGTASAGRAESENLASRLERLAAEGNAEATYHLGMIYHLGLGETVQDARRAFDYFRRGSEAGDPLAAYKVGCFYAGQGGDVVPPNPELALRYKLIAARAGYDLAQVDVAGIYLEQGKTDLALQWFEAAARQGNAQGTGGALALLSPQGPRPDRNRALFYFELLRRHMARMLEAVSDDNLQLSSEQLEAPLREMFGIEATADEQSRAAQLLAEWREQRSALSLRADQGLGAAYRLVGLPLPASPPSVPSTVPERDR